MMIAPKWYGQFEAITVNGIGSMVKRASNYSHFWETTCICFDSEFGTAEETAEMVTALLNRWLEKIDTINDEIEKEKAR